ncbi:MAG: VCBS repeat-containing protein, partial [Desulfobacterales bacterium]
NYFSADVSVLLGNGDGSFQSAVHYGAGFGPWSVAIGDLNGDGGPDLALANANSDDVSVLINTGGYQNEPPTAICQNVTVATEPGTCSADVSVDDGSFDPDGDDITLVQEPPGPYCLGTTEVTLTVTDAEGLSDQCSAAVTVVYQAISVDIDIRPRVLGLKSKGQRIISGIKLPKAYDPRDLARESLELSIPACSHCEVIYPTGGFALWKRYLAFFPRQDLIDEIESVDLNHPGELELKITGELNDGTPFEGLDTIWVIKRKR